MFVLPNSAPMDTTQGAQLLRGRFGEVRGIYYGSHMHLFQYDSKTDNLQT